MTKRWRTCLAGWGTLALLSVLPAATYAQDPDAPSAPAQETPKPAGRAIPPLDTAGDDQPSPDQLLPDSRPLTGVQNQTLGRVESPHSYWIPGFQYSNTVQNSQPGEPNSGWSTTNYLAANVSLLDNWRFAQLALNYSGGASISTDQQLGTTNFQQLGLTQSFQWARWQVQFLNQFSYTDQSEFGFGGGTGLGVPGGGSATGTPQPGLNGGNEQSLFTTVGPRYNDNFTAQAVYLFSPRTSINVSGSYGLLRFVNPGNIDTDSAGASFGYNYALTREDTIGAVFHFDQFSYVGNPQVIDDYVFNVEYGKKITGRLAFQIFGGPDVTTFQVPIGTSTRQISGAGGASLTYAWHRTHLATSYSHAVTPGSGVSAGSNTDQVQTNITRMFGRVWQAQVNVGYARNSLIAPSALQSSYDSVFAGGGISRPFGPNTSFSLAYLGRVQNTSAIPGCTGTSCTTSYSQQQIVMSFQWHTRPLVLK
jgi:hypothetical protein